MIAKPAPKQQQGHLLFPDLLDHLNPKDPLLVLARNLPWEEFEKELTPFYAIKGRPAKPVRLMVGLLLLKQIEHLSDERVVEAWVRNPYYQAFCGMKQFQWNFPCAPSDLVHFRKRIGEEGVEKIFLASVALHGKDSMESDVVVDTTVQEKNITFPTDTKLRMSVIKRSWKVAEQENISLRRSYRRELKTLMRTIRFSKSRKDTKKVSSAVRRVKTIANVLLRELSRKLPASRYEEMKEELCRWRKAVNQQRSDKDKVYSLHEPAVSCICKGKAHKKYEFGSKAAVAMTKGSCVIVGVKSFTGNPYDGDTLQAVLGQIKQIRGTEAQHAFCDRGFRGRKQIGKTSIEIPDNGKTKATEYQKQKARKNFCRRSAIEPVIGHLKSDFRLTRNYLKGVIGDTLNLLLSAAAFNLCKWMRAKTHILHYFLFLVFYPILVSTADHYQLGALIEHNGDGFSEG
ncbi:MAG: IS5 family transposase [Acidaminococcaceae bacterium]|nr:IS5 family transposase [Acidaminococcaceae bacterium]